MVLVDSLFSPGSPEDEDGRGHGLFEAPDEDVCDGELGALVDHGVGAFGVGTVAQGRAVGGGCLVVLLELEERVAGEGVALGDETWVGVSKVAVTPEARRGIIERTDVVLRDEPRPGPPSIGQRRHGCEPQQVVAGALEGCQLSARPRRLTDR